MLEICWFTGAPAPEDVLEIMSCKCSRYCEEDCPCVMNILCCIPACKLQGCTNMEDDEDRSNDTDDSDGETDEDY